MNGKMIGSMITLFIVLLISINYGSSEAKNSMISIKISDFEKTKIDKLPTEKLLLSHEKSAPKSPLLKVFKPDLIEKLIEIENKLDRSWAKKNFQSVDTMGNFELSKNVLKLSYQESNFSQITRQKVLALYFLRWTNRLQLTDCGQLLQHQASMYKSGNKAQRWALLWDTLAISRACLRYKNHLHGIAENLPPAIQKQILLALK